MAAVSTATLHADADRAAGAGDFVSALAASTAILKATPLDHRARLKVGLCLATLGASADAVATLMVVAKTLAHQGFLLSAVGACHDALKLSPDDEKVVEMLRQIHARIHGLESERGRARVPPPIPPSTIDEAQVGAIRALARDALVETATALGTSPPPQADQTEAEQVPLFSDLTEDAFISLVPQIGYLKVPAGREIVVQGQPGTSVYIIVEGEARVVRRANGESLDLARLMSGALFGELAMLTEKPRQATVVTTQPSELFEIDKRSLEAVAERHERIADEVVAFARRRLLFNVMATSAVFEPFAHPERLALLKQFESRFVDAGATLIKDGQQPEGLYVVVEGEVEVSKVDDGGDRVVLAYLQAGEVFGEIGIIEDQPATADVRAVEKSVLLWLDREKFIRFAEAHPAIVEVLKQMSGVRRAELDDAMADGIVLDADDLIIL